MIDYRLGLMCGIDLPFPQAQLVLHQPTINDIAYIGEDDFFSGSQLLCINKLSISQDKTFLANTTNFQIFMTIMSEKKAAEQKEAVIKVLQILLPNYRVIFSPRSIMFINGEINSMLDESNFEEFQNVLKMIFCYSNNSVQQQAFNPANKKAKEIADKIMKGRKRVAELNGDDEASILSQYVSSLTIGVPSMSLKEACNLTLFQMYDLLERYGLWVSWDLDIKTRLAGGTPDGRPGNWMKNIH